MAHSLDLRNKRCPLALILLKQQLLKIDLNEVISVLFSDQEAMQDILLYLDKKNYHYRCEQKQIIISVNVEQKP